MNSEVSFKSSGIYDLTYNVQKNTLLNRGILEIGGIAIPHAAMANNKDEALERAGLSGLFFSLSFLTPLVLLPAFNKFFLKRSGLVKDFKGVEKRILDVSKKYLNSDAVKMTEGIKATAKDLDAKHSSTLHTEAFNKILDRFGDKEELRQKLLKVHKNVYTSDFLSTQWMLGVSPWLCMEFTERRTHKKGFSAAFELKENKTDDKHYQAAKHKKMLANAIVATLPALIAPRIVMKAIGQNHKMLLESANIFKKNYGKFLNNIKKRADWFDYTNAIYMSKPIFALMWLLSDYPNCLICARDKHEVKDKAIRMGMMNVMFFGGDFLISNVLGRLSDKFAGTNVMHSKTAGGNEAKSFWKRFALPMKNLKELSGADVSKRTKTAGALLYWSSLLINMALIGISLPAVLNRILRSDISKEKQQEALKLKQSTSPYEVSSGVFKDFKFNI